MSTKKNKKPAVIKEYRVSHCLIIRHELIHVVDAVNEKEALKEASTRTNTILKDETTLTRQNLIDSIDLIQSDCKENKNKKYKPIKKMSPFTVTAKYACSNCKKEGLETYYNCCPVCGVEIEW